MAFNKRKSELKKEPHSISKWRPRFAQNRTKAEFKRKIQHKCSLSLFCGLCYTGKGKLSKNKLFHTKWRGHWVWTHGGNSAKFLQERMWWEPERGLRTKTPGGLRSPWGAAQLHSAGSKHSALKKTSILTTGRDPSFETHANAVDLLHLTPHLMCFNVHVKACML